MVNAAASSIPLQIRGHYQPLDWLVVLFPCVPKVVDELKAQPRLGGTAERLRQPQRHLRRY